MPILSVRDCLTEVRAFLDDDRWMCWVACAERTLEAHLARKRLDTIVLYVHFREWSEHWWEQDHEEEMDVASIEWNTHYDEAMLYSIEWHLDGYVSD